MCFRVEKESLETSLFEVQELVAQLEARKEQLEGEKQGIELTKQTFQGTVCAILSPNKNFCRLDFSELLHCIGRESPIQIVNKQFRMLTWIAQANSITDAKQGQLVLVCIWMGNHQGKPGSLYIGRQ